MFCEADSSKAGVPNYYGLEKLTLNLIDSLEFLSFQPLHGDIKGFIGGIFGLVAEVPRRFIVFECMIQAQAIDREPVEIGLRAEFLGKPCEQVRQAVGHRPLGYRYAQSFQEGIHKIEKVPGVMIGNEINLPRQG